MGQSSVGYGCADGRFEFADTRKYVIPQERRRHLRRQWQRVTRDRANRGRGSRTDRRDSSVGVGTTETQGNVIDGARLQLEFHAVYFGAPPIALEGNPAKRAVELHIAPIYLINR